MLKMYGWTIATAVIVWQAAGYFVGDFPAKDMYRVGFIYGGIVPAVVFSAWWNLLSLRNEPLPRMFESIRIPFAAAALGMNSVFYKVSFLDPKTNKVFIIPAFHYLFVGIETVLVLVLVIGIYRWGHFHDEQEVHTD